MRRSSFIFMRVTSSLTSQPSSCVSSGSRMIDDRVSNVRLASTTASASSSVASTNFDQSCPETIVS